MRHEVMFTVVLLLMGVAGRIRAEVADVLPVGGVLTDHDNEPLDGAYDMTFALYDIELGGTPLWYEQRTGANQVQVADGLFSVELGAVESLDFLDLIAASDLWLGITVGADSEAGRIHVGSVPYAFEAQYCHQVLGSTCPVGQYLRGWDDDTGEAICETIRLGVGETSNCGLSYSSGTLSITGDDGAALSATSPCFVGVRSPTGGRSATVAFTANATVTDGPSSDTDGNLFGISEADWANPMPMFLGVIYDGTTPFFAISRVPLYETGAVAADVCQKGNSDCDGQWDTLILATGLVLANFTGKPITQVGWFQATYTTTGSAWTISVSPLGGFNQESGKAWFTMPKGQMGALAGEYLSSASGVEIPTWATPSAISFTYGINHHGDVQIYFNTRSAGNCIQDAGAADDDIYLRLPYSNGHATRYGIDGYAIFDNAIYSTGHCSLTSGDNRLTWQISDSNETLEENNFSSMFDDLSVAVTYSIF